MNCKEVSCLGSSGPGWRPLAGCCEHGNALYLVVS